jgi:hypothetical protein
MTETNFSHLPRPGWWKSATSALTGAFPFSSSSHSCPSADGPHGPFADGHPETMKMPEVTPLPNSPPPLRSPLGSVCDDPVLCVIPRSPAADGRRGISHCLENTHSQIPHSTRNDSIGRVIAQTPQGRGRRGRGERVRGILNAVGRNEKEESRPSTRRADVE